MTARGPALALLLGAALRVAVFAAGRPFWHDEAALALNVFERDLAGLAAPLGHGQMAPFGFLALLKGASWILGEGERALRFVPLLLGLAGLPLFLGVARRALSGATLTLACLLFAISEPLVHYAVELKQYGGDTTAILLVWWLALRAREAAWSARACAALGAAGVVLPFFFNAVLLGMAGTGLALAWTPLRCRDRHALRALAAIGLVFAASFALQYALFLHDMTRTAFMVEFWQMAFWPVPPRGGDEWLWLPERLAWVFERSAGFEPVALAALVSVAGALALARRDGALLAMLLLPWALALVASALEAYPFFQRFLLFTAPGLAILLAAGVEGLAARVRSPAAARGLAAVLALALLAMPAARTAHHVAEAWRPQRLRPVMAHVAEARRPGDRVYVYGEAADQLLYELRRLPLAVDDVEIGTISALGSVRDRRRWPFAEAQRLAGSPRVWVVFAHVRTIAERSDEERLVAALDRCGVRLEHEAVPGAAAYLYDLSACGTPDHSM